MGRRGARLRRSLAGANHRRNPRAANSRLNMASEKPIRVAWAFALRASGRLPRVIHRSSAGSAPPPGAGAIDAHAVPAAHACPGIVFLDVKMPGMSGPEALAWMCSRTEFAELPAVMFTSSTQDSDIAFSRERGANDYFVKPSNADNLSKLVGDVLAASRGMLLGSPRLAVDGKVI